MFINAMLIKKTCTVKISNPDHLWWAKWPFFFWDERPKRYKVPALVQIQPWHANFRFTDL